MIIASDLVYTRIDADTLTSERSINIYNQLLTMYTRESDDLTAQIEEIQLRDYSTRPASELARLCRERWLTLANGKPMDKHTSVADMIDALEVSDDLVIARLSKEVAAVVDMIVTCELLIDEEEARVNVA